MSARFERWLASLPDDTGVRLTLLGDNPVESHHSAGTLDPRTIVPGYYRARASTGEGWQGHVGPQAEVSARGHVSEKVQASLAGQIGAAASACDSLADTCAKLHAGAVEVFTEVLGLLVEENRQLRELVRDLSTRAQRGPSIDTGKLLGALPDLVQTVQPGKPFEPDPGKIAEWIRPHAPDLAGTIEGQRGAELADTIRTLIAELGEEGVGKLLSLAQPLQRSYLLRVLDWAKRQGDNK